MHTSFFLCNLNTLYIKFSHIGVSNGKCTVTKFTELEPAIKQNNLHSFPYKSLLDVNMPHVNASVRATSCEQIFPIKTRS